MRKKKGFTMTAGNYYFNIKMGYQNSITISRNTKEEATYAYSGYLKQKKDCEWLGQWDGKKFIDNVYKEAAQSLLKIQF